MSEFDVLSIAADGMGVQRTLLDIAARNVAAAQASSPAHPYARLVAQVAERAPGSTAFGGDDAFDPDGIAAAGDAAWIPDAFDGDDAREDAPFARVNGVSRSRETADALTEMITVLDAQRAYEADASVFDVGKRLAERTIDVGRL